MDMTRVCAHLVRRPYRPLSALANNQAAQFASRAISPKLQSVNARGTRHVSSETPTATSATSNASTESATKKLSSFLDDSLSFTKGVTTASPNRPSRFKSSGAQTHSGSARPDTAHITKVGDGSTQPLDSSVDDLTAHFNSAYFGNDENSLNSSLYRGTTPRRGFDMREMLDPMNNLSKTLPIEKPTPLPVRLGTSLGRSVDIKTDKGIDLSRALKKLDTALRQNAVMVDFHKQRFYERPGIKRKRLASQRWRQHFKKGFQGLVYNVARMKRQGW